MTVGVIGRRVNGIVPFFGTTVRAGELTAAIQRLEWAIERSEQAGKKAKRLADTRA
jgi:hypothetical protein